MLYFLFLSIQLILISFYDLYFERIPNKLLISIFIISFSLLVSFNYEVITSRILSAVIIFSILYLISKFTAGIGAGDIKLISLLAFSVGFFTTVFSVLIACILGIILFLIINAHKFKIKKIPFAPFISAGFFIVKFAGEKIICP